MKASDIIELPTDKEISAICQHFLMKMGKAQQVKRLAEKAAELTLASIRAIESPVSKAFEVAMIEKIAEIELLLIQARMIYGNKDIDRARAIKFHAMKERIKE